MNLPSLNQMTSKVPKCARPWRLIPNEGLLTDRKCLHVTSQVTDGQTRSAHHRLGDNTLFTNLFSVYLLTVPGGKFLLSPFCFWENWSLEILCTCSITEFCDLSKFYWFHVHAHSPSGFQRHLFLLWNVYSILGPHWVLCNLSKQCVHS